MDLQYLRQSSSACQDPPTEEAIHQYVEGRINEGGTSLIQVQLEPFFYSNSIRMKISLTDYTRQNAAFYKNLPTVQYLGIHGILFMTLKVPNGVWTMEQVSRIVRIDKDMGPITWLGTTSLYWPRATDYKAYRKHILTNIRYITGWLSWNPYSLYNSGTLECLGMIKKYTKNYFVLEIPAITRNMVLGRYIIR